MDARPSSLPRRAFLAGAAAAAGAVAGFAFAHAPVDRAPAICPPGAGSLKDFARRCVGCRLCAAACPSGVIRPSADGLAVRVSYDRGLCEFNCKRCTEVCPAGALKLLTLVEKQHTRIGHAVFHPERCVAVCDHHDCGACAEHCPTGALQMVNDDHGIPVPHLTPELCIGCGNCEHPCPVRPARAIVVEPVTVQDRATDPQEYFKAHPPKANAPMSEGGDWLI